jgi:hypothetical protein
VTGVITSREDLMAKIICGEIILPETKPETEWLRGRAVRKMSPLWTHSKLQQWWLLRLSAWAVGRGEVCVDRGAAHGAGHRGGSTVPRR